MTRCATVGLACSLRDLGHASGHGFQYRQVFGNTLDEVTVLPGAAIPDEAMRTVIQIVARKSVETLFRLIESGGRSGLRETTLYDGTLVMRGSA